MPDQRITWTLLCVPHMHCLYSLWSKACHDVKCCGQIDNCSKLLWLSYLGCVCVTDISFINIGAAAFMDIIKQAPKMRRMLKELSK